MSKNMNTSNMNTSKKYWNPQYLICGYIVMSAFYGELTISRDVSHMPLS